MSSRTIEIPKIALWLLHMMTGYSFSDNVRGDCLQMYFETARQRGMFIAKVWIWSQVLKSVPLFLQNTFSKSKDMFKNYLKTAFRHLYRNKLHSFINVAGLSLSLSIFLVVVLYVAEELSFDTFHNNADAIYRVNTDVQNISYTTEVSTVPIRVGRLLKDDFPEIKHLTRILKETESLIAFNDTRFFETEFMFTDSAFFDVFSFEIEKISDEIPLRAPGTVLITREAAQRYFGDKDPVGEVITYSSKWVARKQNLTIQGIIAKPPSNSHISFEFLANFATFERSLGLNNNNTNPAADPSWVWNWNSTAVYLLFNENVDPESFEAKMPDFVERQYPPNIKETITLTLAPLTDLHFDTARWTPFEPAVNMVTVYILLSLAFFILFIACINFMNLSTAKAITRGKEVGMRKVLGACRSQIVKQYLFESNLVSFIAIIISLGFLQLSLPVFNQLVGRELTIGIFSGTFFVLFLLAVSFIVGIMSGFYPAFFLSGFLPSKVLKGKLFQHTGNERFQRSLVVVQFAISAILISGTLLIYQQVDFMYNKDMGFERNNIVFMDLSVQVAQGNLSKFRTFKEELRQGKDVRAVTAIDYGGILGDSAVNLRVKPEESQDTEEVRINYIGTDRHFRDVFDIGITQGAESLNNEYAEVKYYLNQNAARSFGWDEPIGKKITARSGVSTWSGSVAGLITNFNFESLYNEITPLILAVHPTVSPGFGYLVARLEPGRINEGLAFLENKWEEFYPHRPFNVFFLDENLRKIYHAEQKLTDIMIYLTVFGIFIACLGLFGLASFLAQRRIKEIGVRKVLGAKVSDITVMLSKDFAKLVLYASLLAIPFSYYIVSIWLQNFAYRIHIGITTFAVSTIFVLIVALSTVSYQSVKAAMSNPVKSIRSD